MLLVNSSHKAFLLPCLYRNPNGPDLDLMWHQYSRNKQFIMEFGPQQLSVSQKTKNSRWTRLLKDCELKESTSSFHQNDEAFSRVHVIKNRLKNHLDISNSYLILLASLILLLAIGWLRPPCCRSSVRDYAFKLFGTKDSIC